MHGAEFYNSLSKFFSPTLLPPEYGGEGPGIEAACQDWTNQLLQSEKLLQQIAAHPTADITPEDLTWPSGNWTLNRGVEHSHSVSGGHFKIKTTRVELPGPFLTHGYTSHAVSEDIYVQTSTYHSVFLLNAFTHNWYNLYLNGKESLG